MKKIIQCILAAVAAIAVVSTGPTALAASGAGIIDAQRVMGESLAIRNMQEKLDARGRELAERLAEEQGRLSAEEMVQRSTDLYKEYLAYKLELEVKIKQELQQAADSVKKEYALDTVVYRQNGNDRLPEPNIDITDDVLFRMETVK